MKELFDSQKIEHFGIKVSIGNQYLVFCEKNTVSDSFEHVELAVDSSIIRQLLIYKSDLGK